MIGSSLGGVTSTLYPYAPSTNGGVSRIAVTNRITIADGGAINADGRGYAPGYGPGKGNGGDRGGGGGHGGRGGRGGYNTGGTTNGSLTNPIGPGSGGAAYRLYLGYGGGTVWLQAGGRVLVDGLISANGTGSDGGGGAGGAVNIGGNVFGGNGIIRANGGDGMATAYNGGAGGGGRIALDYQSLEGNPSVQLSTATERGNISIFQSGGPEMGTLYLPDTQLLDGGRHENLRYTKVTVEGMTEWSPASLTITDAVFGFSTGMTINVAGSVMVQSANAQLVLNEHSQLICGGDLVLTNGGAMRVYAGATNAIPEDYGARVQVAGSTGIDSSTADISSLYLHSHETDGGSALLALNSLTVGANGHINADRSGFGPGQGLGKGFGGDRGGGGGYGGQGCRGGYSLGGITNGSAVFPDIPGSGGALFSAVHTHYGHGGGLVRIEAAGSVVLDGLMSANGTPASGSVAGGAGGGINILCGTFAGGAGSLTANGLGGGTWGGGGGGGRITVWQAKADQREAALAGNWSKVTEPDLNALLTGGVTVLAGEKGSSYTVADPDQLGQPGTIRFFLVPPPGGTLFYFR